MENDSDLQPVTQSVSDSAIVNSTAVTEEQDNNIANQNGNYEKCIIFFFF